MVLGLAACGGERSTPPANERSALGGDVAARVGDEVIPVSLVAKVAADQHISAEEALRRLVDDAIVASAARRRGIERTSAWRLSSARARFTADKLLAEAKAKGPPTDDEVRELSAVHWREVDRPASVRTIHALVHAADPKIPVELDRTQAVAEAVRAAVSDAKDEADFKARAEAVSHPKELEIRVESLPPFIESGELTDANGAMVPEFASAAHALSETNPTSAPVTTRFGIHVIRLLERIPERRMPLESRRLAFADRAYADRVKLVLDARLAELSRTLPSKVLPSAEQTMRELNELGGPTTP
jgi:peptidyl-prolyl cis-trans isomerase C